MIKIISFPCGGGGNWLKSIIEQEPLQKNFQTHHFHDHTQQTLVDLSHCSDPANFDYLLSGSYYFNFFVNVIYKWFYIQDRFTTTRDYKDYYTTCVSTARLICEFSNLENLIFFNFDDLLADDKKFYNKLTIAFPKSTLPYQMFSEYKERCLKTMVRINNHYENFDSQIWVTFVLGQLMNVGIVPTDFSIYDRDNQHLASQFARENYKHCHLIRVHHFESDVILPDIL